MTDIYEPTRYFGFQYGPADPMRTCARDLQALELLRADLAVELGGYDQPLYMFQGCYHDGTKSAGTHTGSSVYDLHPSDAEPKARLGARHGIIVFHRPFNWDGQGGGEHLHCIIRGGQKISPEAKAQVAAWDKHLDGLADGQPYTGPWFDVKPFTYHAHQQGAGTDPWGTIALTAKIGVLHSAGVPVTGELQALVAKHPNAPEWQVILDEHIAAQAALEARHTRAFHLSHKGA